MSLNSTATENAGHNSAVFKPAEAQLVSESARLKSLEHGHVDQGQSAQTFAIAGFLYISIIIH